MHNVSNKHSMAAHHTINNGRTLPLPYWVYLLLGRVNSVVKMKYRELQTRKDAPSNHNLENEDRFIHFYGQFNCKILKFKDANTVVNLMQKEDPTCLGVNEKQFIVKHSNKEVLCHICHSYEDRPDIFVYGDDNIAFTVDCFV